MYRLNYRVLVCASLCIFAASALAEDRSATASCNFDTAKQLAVRYQRIPLDAKKKILDKIPDGEVWAPGGHPMTMFTNTALTAADNKIPIGAYTLFIIPGEKTWTLIISKSTDTSGKYDQQMDLARVPMQLGELSASEDHFSVHFAHVTSDQCNMRIYLQSIGAFTAFKLEK